MKNFSLDPKHTGLLIIDVQDKLFSQMERNRDMLLVMQKMIKGAIALGLPIVVSEQYPQGLGPTIATLKAILPDDQVFLPKTSFSCYQDPALQQVLSIPAISQWILIGLEAHVCVLQTAKDLIENQKLVVVLNDAISSRSIYDYSTAIAEMRDIGARISSTETVLFELVKDAKSPHFKAISQLVKA